MDYPQLLIESFLEHMGAVKHQLNDFDGTCCCGWDYMDSPDYEDDPDLDEVWRRHWSGEEEKFRD